MLRNDFAGRTPADAARRLARVATVLAVALLAGCTTFGFNKKAAQNAVPPPPPPPALGKLAPGDVQTALGTGANLNEVVVGGKTYTLVLNADGTAKRTATGSTTAETGTWRAADAGYCSKWGKATTEQCYAITRTAATTYDVLDTKSKVIAHISA